MTRTGYRIPSGGDLDDRAWVIPQPRVSARPLCTYLYIIHTHTRIRRTATCTQTRANVCVYRTECRCYSIVGRVFACFGREIDDSKEKPFQPRPSRRRKLRVSTHPPGCLLLTERRRPITTKSNAPSPWTSNIHARAHVRYSYSLQEYGGAVTKRTVELSDDK